VTHTTPRLQVKCVTFLTWLLRSYPAAIITHRAAVTDALVHLLRTAPDVVPIRKELLVAMRNTLTLQQVRECVPRALTALLHLSVSSPARAALGFSSRPAGVVRIYRGMPALLRRSLRRQCNKASASMPATLTAVVGQQQCAKAPVHLLYDADVNHGADPDTPRA